MLKFTSVFTCDVQTAECRALTAPCIADIYPQLAKGTKRPADVPKPTVESEEGGLSKGQIKRARNQAAKAKAAAKVKAEA